MDVIYEYSADAKDKPSSKQSFFAFFSDFFIPAGNILGGGIVSRYCEPPRRQISGVNRCRLLLYDNDIVFYMKMISHRPTEGRLLL